MTFFGHQSSFFTWSNPSSTGTWRSKMSTSTFSFCCVRVDVDDLAVEVGERPARDLDRLAERELDLGALPLGERGARLQDAVDLGLRQRDRRVAGADEPGDARRVLHDRPRLVVQIHVHEHVAREDALLGLHLLAVLRLDHLLGRHDHAPEPRPLVHRDDAVLEIGLDLVLVAGVGVDDVPAKHGYFREDVSDEGLECKVGDPEVGADDRAGDDHDDRARITCYWLGHSTFFSSAIDSLTKRRKPPPGTRRDPVWVFGTCAAGRTVCCGSARAGRRPAARRPERDGAGAVAAGCSSAIYLVSRCAVWRPHQRQYFFSSTRSGVFRFDFEL